MNIHSHVKKKVMHKLRELTVRLPLATGVSSCNLTLAFFDMSFFAHCPMKVAVLTVLYFYLPVSHYLNFLMTPIVASFLTSLSRTDVQIVRKDQHDGNGEDRHQGKRESDDESLNHASSAVEGAPSLFLFLDDIL